MTHEQFKKLKPGDMIVSNSNFYHLTNKQNEWRGVVVEKNGDCITATTIYPYGHLFKDSLFYDLNYQYFDLFEDQAPIVKSHEINERKTIVTLSNGAVEIARCHPDDKFNAYEGLRIATARAYGKEAFSPSVSLATVINNLSKLSKKPCNEPTNTNDKITLKDFFNSKDENIAIHPNNKYEEDTLLEAFNAMGKKWQTGESYLEYHTDNPDFNIAYYPRGTYGSMNGAVEWLETKVYEFTDVILPKINKHAFKVGERVQFKSWEEMAKEFGVKKFPFVTDYINSDIVFTEEMKPLCGTYATIMGFIDGNKVRLCNHSYRGNDNIYRGRVFSLDVLKHIDRTKKEK